MSPHQKPFFPFNKKKKKTEVILYYLYHLYENAVVHCYLSIEDCKSVQTFTGLMMLHSCTKLLPYNYNGKPSNFRRQIILNKVRESEIYFTVFI